MTHPSQYFRNLMDLEWKVSNRNGDPTKPQYEDTATGQLMMLPTDMALKVRWCFWHSLCPPD
jgi:hypothetical protein